MEFNTLQRILRQKLFKYGTTMDKEIIKVKKKNDEQMDKLVKKDIVRDKACDKAKDMAKKKK